MCGNKIKILSSEDLKILGYADDLIKYINNELLEKGFWDIQYALINNDIDYVIEMVENNSVFYNKFCKNSEDFNSDFKILFRIYCETVKKRINAIFIKEGGTDATANSYVARLSESVCKNEKGIWIAKSKDNIVLSKNEVERTMILMKEAVEAYYKVYYNKIAIAELTSDINGTCRELEFKIKEEQLLHLLGVNLNQLRNHPDFKRLYHYKSKSSVDILRWILEDIDGNCDLLQYNEEETIKRERFLDYYKKVSNDGKFRITYEQFSAKTDNQLLSFMKIRSKSETFLKFGPFETTSLVAKLGKDANGNQKTLSKNTKSTLAMISSRGPFRKFPWSYLGFAESKYQNLYAETLQIDTSQNKKNLFLYSKPAIIKKVSLLDFDDDDSSVGSKVHIFSEKEQFSLFVEAYNSFKNVMDFTELYNYFINLRKENNLDLFNSKHR